MRFINRVALRIGSILNIFHYPIFSDHEFVYQVNPQTVFHVRKNSSDIPEIKETWFEQQYFRPDFQIQKTDTVVDIGAYIGDFSVYAAQKATAGKVFAVEPADDNFRLLLGNKKLNRIKNLKAFNLAISKQNGKSKFFLSSTHTIHSLKKNGANNSTIVSTITLETFMKRKNIKRIHFLKIDIEGAEYEIVPHLKSEVLKKIDKIVLEFHDYLDNNNHFEKLKKYLEQNGFIVNIFPAKTSYRLSKQGYLWARR